MAVAATRFRTDLRLMAARLLIGIKFLLAAH